MSKMFLAVLALAGTMGAAGCASKGGKSGGEAKLATGMMCPKCETVWVAEQTHVGTKVQVLQTKATMACPDCDAMAKSQLMGDGKVKLHDCPSCKVTPQPVTPAKPRHPKATHS